MQSESTKVVTDELNLSGQSFLQLSPRHLKQIFCDDDPQYVAARDSIDEFKLYELIWKRTMASQMAEAKGRRMAVKLTEELGGPGHATTR